jgi:cytochrome c-type biogenesis protein
MLSEIRRVLQPVHKDVTQRVGDAVVRSDYVRVMFGIEIIDASLLPAMFVALVGGIISFLSPCVLPIVPPYLAYMSGVTIGEIQGTAAARRKAILAAVFFVMGLSTVFLLLGFTASAFGAFVLQNQELFAKASGVVVIIFGLHFLSVFRIPILDREARMETGETGGSALGAYVLGLAFAFGWTPCIGPQLGAILSLAASEASVSRGTLLLGVYALGLGVPFLLAAIFLNRSMVLMNRIKRHMSLIEKLMGGLLLVVGFMLVTGLFTSFSFWLLETFPALATLG